jgi:hypothetical protein
MRRVRAITMATVACSALSLAACAHEPAPRSLDFGSASGSIGTVTPSGQGVVSEWIGVFRAVADVSKLDADTAELKAAVDGAIVVSPVDCFDGLLIDDPGVTYVLGVVAPTKEQLDAVVDLADRPTIFEGRVRTMCLD